MTPENKAPRLPFLEALEPQVKARNDFIGRRVKENMYMTPREFWLNDNCANGYAARADGSQCGPDEIHVIEYSAYLALKAKLEIAREALEAVVRRHEAYGSAGDLGVSKGIGTVCKKALSRITEGEGK